MDKTININLGDILFQIDEDAYRILRDYLQAINNRFANVQGGHETVEDIESRIAEIFQSHKGLAGVITKENVETMISTIGKPEDFDVEETVIETPYRTVKKRMYRNTDDMIIGGVCSGIAAYLDSDTVLFRILFVIFALFFGVGFLVYLALWIALPAARTDSQKKELYGNTFRMQHKSETGVDQPVKTFNDQSRIGNAINEVFRAIGKVFYVSFRIFLILIGGILVVSGFLFIVSYVIIFIFKYPGIYSIDSPHVNMLNIPDFLNYIVNPSLVPWILILATISFILPMLAIIYWGVKMIFWFKARDGVISLIAFVVWILAITVLAIIGFNEGISFAESARATTQVVLPHTPDTLYIHSDKRVADLKYEKEISLPHEEYSVFINDDNKIIYIRPHLTIDLSEDKQTSIEINKRSAGRSERDANNKAESLVYNYNVNKDTLKIDEYFELPSGRKWAADDIEINLSVPSGVILKFDNMGLKVQSHIRNRENDYYESRWESGRGLWVMTDEGLESVTEKSSKNRK